MGIAITAFLLVLPLFLTGCEDVANADDIPYVERLVIRGNLIVGKTQGEQEVEIRRTVPLNTEATDASTAIPDADAAIEVDGLSYPLSHRGTGHYGAPNLIVTPGKLYKLTVAWKGKKVTASTIAPEPVPVDSVGIERVKSRWDESTFPLPTAVFRPRGNQVYLLSYDLIHPNMPYPEPFPIRRDQRIVRLQDTINDGTIHLAGNFEEYYVGGEEIDSVRVTLHGYDYPFYPYYLTQRSIGFDDDIFGGGKASAIQWNVQGDGFGMFIATWTTEKSVHIE